MNDHKRRDCSPAQSSAAKKPRKNCSYGENCYRRNPAHLREYSHPHLESILDEYSGSGDFPIPDSLIMQKPLIEEQLQILIDKKIHERKTKPQEKPLNKVESEIPYGVEPKNVFSFNKNYASNPKIGGVKNQRKEVEKESSKDNLNLKYKDRPSTSTDQQGLVHTSAIDTVATPIEKKNVKIEEEKIVNDKTVTKLEVPVKNATPKAELKEDMVVPKLPTAKDLVYSDYRPIVPPTRRIQDHFKVVAPKGKMAEKHKMAAPYYIFYTTITDSKETHKQKNSITFQEILDPSLGELKCSLQINFMVDIGWLMAHYYFAGYSKKRLTILYGEDMPDLRTISQKHRHIDAHFIPMANPFGKHHTKMMLLCYEDGSLRVVVSTANLYHEDWENRTQGLWMSPRCPPLPDGSMPFDGDSPTFFKKHLLQYLDYYRSGYLTQYAERVRRCDLSHINVFLITSVPGGHVTDDWGMYRVGRVLSAQCPPLDQWPVVAQSSSLGSFGKTSHAWLCSDFLTNFSKTIKDSGLKSPSPLKVIYPSLENVQQSHDGLLGGGCLPYSAMVHTKQQWFNNYLHQWKAAKSHRDRAMPHIKTYLRTSPDFKMAAYYLLTSANISKAAWGTITKKDASLRVNNYEAGVMFLPKYVINQDFFPLEETQPNYLPLTYDLPPVRYSGSMSPWVMEYLRD